MSSAPTVPATKPAAPPAARRLPIKRIVIGVLAVGAVALAIYFGIPMVDLALNTVSTDDAYVTGHVTFVAARVAGQVVKVWVDDNNRVKKGDILVQLDKQPFQIDVDLKKAMVATAKANLLVAEDEVRAMVAQARANRFKLQHTIEDVNNQIAVLRANVAALQTSQAKLNRAKADWNRALEVQKTPGAISKQEVDLYEEAYRVAERR